MQMMSELRVLYGEYIAKTESLARERSATSGLLGFKRGPEGDPSHDSFIEKMETALQSFAAQAPASGEVSEVLRYIYEAPLKLKDNMLAYWILVSVQALTENVIGFLSAEDAAALSALFQEAYPKSARLPAQKSVAKRLMAQAGDSGGQKRKGLSGIFKRR